MIGHSADIESVGGGTNHGPECAVLAARHVVLWQRPI
jgi:hypothetical protein